MPSLFRDEGTAMASSAGVAAATLMYFLTFLWVVSCSTHAADLAGIDVEKHQAVNATPVVLVESVLSKDVVRCARVPISGMSRIKLGSYSSAHKVTVVPSPEIPEKSYQKILICLHKNSSLGLCQCENDGWEIIQKGMWSSVISPYGNRYIDVKFANNLSGSVTVSVKTEFQRWRLLCLAVGVLLLLLAPIVSSWVPFYYSSSMAIGICLVVIILLFQGMKLLPTSRKNFLYSSMCGLAVGAGSFLLNRLSMFVNSILVNFGISEEMHNPVLIFLLVGVVIAGAGFGYWLVRKFIVDEDGTVDVGVAQFVKWALRMIAVTFIFQSTLDTPLAMALLVSYSGIYFCLTSIGWHNFGDITFSRDGSPLRWSNERVLTKKKRAEFLSRSGGMNSHLWKTPKSAPAWSNSPIKGIVSPPSRRGARSPQATSSPFSSSGRKGSRNPDDFYSVFHKTPNRKKFSEQEWKQFTEESTRQAVGDLAASPEFTDWIVKNADRIQLHKEDSSDGSFGSGSDSTDETLAESSSGRGLFWRGRW